MGSENECDANFHVGIEEEQERQKQPCEESDANESRRARSTSNDSVALAIRFKTPTKPGICRKDSGQKQPTTPVKRKREPSPEPSPELELFNPREEDSNAWQLGESADDFVQRLQPSTASISTCTGIWAENPHRDPRNKLPCPRVEYFKIYGKGLLDQSLNNRHEIRESSATLPKGSLANKLIQEGKSLQERIAKLARDTYVRSGKWMLFVRSEDVDRVWKQVVAGVIENQLGCSCKVTTSDRNDEHLICVYTKDFQDTKDVLRVLHELEKMDLVSANKSIYYKSDAYTYLNLGHGKAAKYALPPALYDSRSMLAAQKF